MVKTAVLNALLLATLGSATPAPTVPPSCKAPTAPAKLDYSAKMTQTSRRSGVNDFAAKWTPATGATGYVLCWDIVGVDKFTEDYVKTSTCVKLDGKSTVYNNGERTLAMARISNTFQNVRVAAVSSCGAQSAFTAGKLSATDVVPYACPPTEGQGIFADSVTLKLGKVTPDRTATGTVAWDYGGAMGYPGQPAPAEMVCLGELHGDLGITEHRTCFLAGPGAKSTPFTLTLRDDTVLLVAEVRQLGSCDVDYDMSAYVGVPQKPMPWGTDLVNQLQVCLQRGKNNTLTYGKCQGAKVLQVTAEVSSDGLITGAFKTADGKCVAVRGNTVALGACPADGGWMAWRKNSAKSPGTWYVREFQSNMCMPFGAANTKIGAAPTLTDCSALDL